MGHLDGVMVFGQREISPAQHDILKLPVRLRASSFVGMSGGK